MKPEKTQEALDNIDKGLQEAQTVTIEEALERAIANGMPIKEAELILDHFRTVFHKEA